MEKEIVILAKQILAGEELEVKKGCAVLVQGDRIKAILSETDVEVLRQKADQGQVQILDLGGRTLLPGLFECHNHLALDAGLEGHLGMMGLSECEHTVLAIQGLKKDLYSGVTTARCMGDRNYLDVKMKQIIAEGRVEGPDLLVCGIGMRARHGHGEDDLRR